MKIILFVSLLLSLCIVTSEVFAQAPGGRTSGNQPNVFQITQPQGYGINVSPGNTSGEFIVGTIVKNVVTLLFTVGGIGTVIYFIWGAVDWILSGGDKEKISNARKKMTHALIGLALLSLSFVIIRTVGQVTGFNPLCQLQIRGLGDAGSPNVNCQ